ncbi:AraC family transcriptional regulator [Flavobacterium sp.]|uniref:helix-turn-helix domain-containing protein n=1 Tax=Flavobacterium sp. TaxID=239 RepID=UPI00286B5FBD|nr:AraC family transcriptional regulator [Flavobacterium sp.]
MKLFLKFDINNLCNTILQEQLDKFELKYDILGFGEINIKSTITDQKLTELNEAFSNYGIQVVENQKSIIVQKIKDTIVEMVHSESGLNNLKSSVYLSEKLNHSYGYISNLFSDVTYTSVENYIIIQKIERVKQLILINELTLTEIAYKLNYSSVAHLSTQFKNITGITPSAFQRIITKRRNNNVD